MGYSIKGTRDKLWLGAGGEIISSSTKNNFIWNVKALYNISTKTYLYVKYLNANTSDFAIENAMYYYNSTSVLVDNFNMTYGYYFTPKFSWYLNYQFENAKDLDYDLSFSYNTIITGIKIDF
jgi:predicted porin